MTDHTLSQKKYYFSFDEDIVAKKFKNVDDFVWYMQIKYGIDFNQPNLLLLNEIQYSKDILQIFNELLARNIRTQIIATGIIHTRSQEYQQLIQSRYVRTITVYPFSFFDFLDMKDIHTTYLSLQNPSQVVFKEIQWLFDEYMIRWWYPALVTSSTQDRKQQALRAIIQKVYDKDVWFYFNGDEILLFQDLFQSLCRQTMTGYNLKTLARELDISLPLLKKYVTFFVDNCLIESIPYFYENKKRELCHQEHVALSDTGLVSYMTKNYGSKLYDEKSIKNFICIELLQHIASDDVLMTYKKINNSAIDFVISHSDGTLTPIMVSDKNTTTVPKIYNNFSEYYGHRIRRYIKATPLLAGQSIYREKDFVCVPYFMISKCFVE